MVSNKLRFKRVFMTVIIVFVIVSVINFGATKIIYDKIFSRYDCATEQKFGEITNDRKIYDFKSGKNTLRGYLYQSEAKTDKDTLIVFAVGHKACSNDYLWQIKELLDLGWSVFTFDPTGCCDSQGKNEVGFSQELLDLTSTLDYIEECNRFDCKEIALLGHSRGGYAVCCALEYKYDISAVISIGGVNSAMEGIMGASRDYIGKLAYLNYGPLWLYQTMLFGADVIDLKANEVIEKSNVPTLIIHGANDEQVPTDKFSIYSYKNINRNKNVEYLLFDAPENSGHVDILFDEDKSANDALIGKINDFLIGI